MPWFCSSGGCINSQLPFSKKEAQEVGYTCVAACCGSPLLKREVVVVPTKPTIVVSKPHVVNKTPSTRVKTAPLPTKQRCDVVVSIAGPPALELVYPSLVCKKDAVVPKTPTPITDKLVGNLLPPWARATPSKIGGAQEADDWPEGAVVYNGTNYYDDHGRIVLSQGAKELLVGVRKLAHAKAKKAAIQRRQQKRRLRTASQRRAAARFERVRALLTTLKSQLALQEAKHIVLGQENGPELSEAQVVLVNKMVDQSQNLQQFWEGFVRKMRAHKASVKRAAAEARRLADEQEVASQEAPFPEQPAVVGYVKACPAYRLAQRVLSISEGAYDFEDSVALPLQTLAKRLNAVTRCDWRMVATEKYNAILTSLDHLLSYVPEGKYYSGLANFLDKSDHELAALCKNMEAECEVFRNLHTTAPAHGFTRFMCDSAKKIGSYLLARSQDLYIAIANKSQDAVRSAINFIFEEIRKQFARCMTPYLQSLYGAKDIIENFWQKCRGWVTNVWNSAPLQILLLGVAAMWMMFIIITGVIVYLVEKLLIGMGILSTSGVVLGSFTTLLAIYLGLKTFGSCEALSGVNEIWKMALAYAIRGDQNQQAWRFMREAIIHENVTQAHATMDSPLAFMMQVGSSLLSGSASSARMLGKWGQTMDQIRKGKDCTKELLAFITERCGDLYATITGSDAEIFAEIQSLVRIDMVRWIQDSQKVLRHAVSSSPNDAVTFALVDRLAYDGDILLRNIDNSGKKISPGMARCVSSLHKELKELYKSLSASGQFEERMKPFWVYIYGEPQCGKSLASSTIVQELLAEIGAPPTSIACKTQMDKYFSRYHRERAVLIDDISSTTIAGGQNLEPEMIQIVSTAEYSVAKADCSEKGMLFDSEIIVSTSNFFDAPTLSGINCKQAYQERRAVVLQCRRSSILEFDPEHPQAAVEARFVDRCTEMPIHVEYMIKPKQRLKDIDAQCEQKEEWAPLLQKLEDIKRYMAHFRYQETVLLGYRRKQKERATPMYEDGMKFILHNIKNISELNKFAIPTADNAMLMAVDGKAYSVSISGYAKEYTLPSADIGMLELRTLNRTCDHVTANLPEGMRRGMVGCFLDGICEGRNHVDSVEKMSFTSSTAYREFFSSLNLAERIYLRAVQKRVDSVENHPCGFFQADWKLTLISKLKESFDQVWNGKGRIVLMLLALVLIVVSFWKFFSVLRGLCQGVGIAGFYTAFQTLDAHSVIASSSAGDSYIARSAGSSYRQTVSRAHSATDDIFNADYCTDMLVRIDVIGRVIVSAVRGRNRSLILTNHQAISIPDRSTVYITYTSKGKRGQSFPHEWLHKNIISYEGCEAVIYASPQLSPLPSGAENRFLDNPMELPKDFEIHGSVIKLRKNFMTELGEEDKAQNPETPLLFHWISRGTVAVEKHTLVTEINGTPYSREMPCYIRSNCPTHEEDCGAILSVMHRGMRKIIGIHVSGNKYVRGGKTVYISSGSLLPSYEVMPAHSNLPSCVIPELGLNSDGVDKIGYISSKSVIPHIATKTQFVKVPELYRYPGKIEKEPAILSKDDERIPDEYKGYNPLVDGIKKFENPMQPLDERKLKEVASSIVSEWHDCASDLLDVDLDIVINGEGEEDYLDAMVMGTSEGYPYVLERKSGEKGKLRYFQPTSDDPERLELRPGTSVARDFERLMATACTVVPELECMEIPKDERLPLRKIYGKPGTRLFSCLPLPYNMALRMKYLSFAQMLQSHRYKLPCQVGINPASREWQEMYMRLAEKSDKALNCDYSKFDGLMTYQILNIIADMINLCYQDDTQSKNVRKNLLLGICNRKSIAGSQVYEVRAGIPSGCALTVLLNSIFNEILVKYVYMSVVPDPERCYFNRHVSLMVYGDDNLIAIGNDVIQYFNGNVIKRTMAQFGVTITDGTDKTSPVLEAKPLQQLDFLKRGFKRLSTGQILAPLDKTAIYASLQYVNAGGGDVLGPLRLNVENSLRELWAHQDQTEFDRVRRHFEEKCGYRNLPNWAYFTAWYGIQLSGKTAYAPHRHFEVQPANVGARAILHSQARQDAITGIGNRLAVACHGYKPGANDFVVAIGDPLRNNEEGVVLAVPLAHGSGGAVTTAFTRKVRSNVHIQENYAAGKNIVFRDRQPCVNAWVAAIAFTSMVGGSEQEALRFFREHRPNGISDLSEFFEKERRFIARSDNPWIPSIRKGKT